MKANHPGIKLQKGTRLLRKCGFNWGGMNDGDEAKFEYYDDLGDYGWMICIRTGKIGRYNLKNYIVIGKPGELPPKTGFGKFIRSIEKGDASIQAKEARVETYDPWTVSNPALY